MVRRSAFRKGLVAVWALGQTLLPPIGCASQTVAMPLSSSAPSSPVGLPKEPIGTVTAMPKIAFTPTATSAAVPFSAQPEDTQIQVADGPGDIAWSHKGDRLAYVAGYSLYIVPVGQWREPSEVFRASLEDGPWDLDDFFVAWSPDDSAIGVTLEKPVNAQGHEGRIAQVDWRRGTFSLIAPDEEASLIDWSTTNRIVVTRRGSGYWVFDVPSGHWQRLLRSGTDELGAVGFPRWSLDGNLILGETVNFSASSNEVAFYKVAPDTNQWQPLHINIDTFFAYTGDPVPSPDGRWIAWLEGYMTGEGAVWQIKLYDQKNDVVTEAANNQADQTQMWEALAWSPDSRQLAFSAGRGGSYDRTIWILHLDMPN